MKKIEQKVLKFIDRHNLISAGDKILVALSGGPDSVFALYFFHKFSQRFKIEIAAVHIHHQLRGTEADLDEILCKELCEKLDVNFNTVKVNVKNFAKANKLSIEEAARFLRYGEFRSVAEKTGCNKILTAHNMNDNTETVLLNLFKGTGLAGVSGIPIERQNIIRPLLSLTKDEILEYLHENKIQYRIDSTNFSNDFKRNFIRNKIVPAIKEGINPSLDETIQHSSEIFRTSNRLVFSYIEKIFKDFVSFNNGRIEVDLAIIEEFGEEVLGEIFMKSLRKYFAYEFSFEDYLKLIELVRNQTGKKIELTGGLEAFRARKKVLIGERIEEKEFVPVEIKAGESKEFEGKTLNIEIVNWPAAKESLTGGHKKGEEKSITAKNYELISADNLHEIFILRKWKPGDKFIPLGMNSYKKISDFLNEQKVPSLQKKEQFVLENNSNIVWVIGLRIDNRYKLKEGTKRVCKLWMN